MSSYVPKRLDRVYVENDPFQNEEEPGVRRRTVRIVTTKAERTCVGAHLSSGEDSPHVIVVGERAFLDKAIFQKKWVSAYVCLKCFDAYLDEMGVE